MRTSPAKAASMHQSRRRRKEKTPAEAQCNGAFGYMAERVGFEPTVPLPVRLISSQVHSTTLPPLRVLAVKRSIMPRFLASASGRPRNGVVRGCLQIDNSRHAHLLSARSVCPGVWHWSCVHGGCSRAGHWSHRSWRRWCCCPGCGRCHGCTSRRCSCSGQEPVWCC